MPGEANDVVVWRLCSPGAATYGQDDEGVWDADWAGLFIVKMDSTDGGCPNDSSTLPWPKWLTRAAGYRVDGSDRLLLDRSGRVIARLVPLTALSGVRADGPPATDPVATRAMIASFAPTAGLPAGLLPATRSQLVGRWVPVGYLDRPEQPYLFLDPKGGVTSTGGCGGNGWGPWIAGPGGAILALQDNSSLVYCPPSPTPFPGSWLTLATRAGFDHGVLVLVDAHAHTVGRLVSDNLNPLARG